MDRIDEQLDLAVTEVSVVPRQPAAAAPPPPERAPAPPRRPRAADRSARRPRAADRPAPKPRAAERPARKLGRSAPAMSVPELLELGLVEEADAAMARATDRRDALTWTGMRALLDGRKDAATAAMEELRTLAETSSDSDLADRSQVQRFWAAVEWGSYEERLDVLDHCRTRAYRFDDFAWWGHLTLLLAVMGKQDEAARAFDEAYGLVAGGAKDGAWLDVLTNLIEAAALLGDGGRVNAAGRLLRWPEDRLVVVGPAAVCKGSVERYRGLAHAAAGRWDKAQACFAQAESTHRAIGAGPLLHRTLQQSGAPAAA